MITKLREKASAAVPNWLVYAVSIPATVGLCFLLLEFSSVSTIVGDTTYHIFQMEPQHLLLNLLTIGVLWILPFLLTNRVWLAGLTCSYVCGIIAIVNHFVLIYHGMPFSFLVLRNFTTALNVISGYTFSVDIYVVKMLAAIGVLTVIALTTRFLTTFKKDSLKTIIIRDAVLLVFCFAVAFLGYGGPNPIKPVKTLTWIWTEPYLKYGYAPCTVESFFQSLSVVNQPDGYTPDAMENVVIPQTDTAPGAAPDIILILNESFYDLRQITDLETDHPYMPNIENMDNLLTGYAIIPGAGGGTNSAEYELLTSNSLQLMPGVTPFNALSLENANSIVSHLSRLGYSTLGSHSEPGINYSRNIGYDSLGFDKAYFEPNFTDVDYYHDSYFETDASLYRNLIRWYEESPAEVPRFLYMLTIQNHANYNMNDSQYDRIHVLGDYGEHTQSINEFLTYISLSDEAFLDLTAYFSTVDRPVVICMVGDHAPSFAADIIDPKYSQDEAELRYRTVPLLIWANYPLEDGSLGTMSMNYVVPTLLDISGVRLSPYYSYLIHAKQQVPVLTSYGKYYDKDGNLYSYSSDGGALFEQLVDNYFYLEYHNLQRSRNQSLYDPIS